MTTRKRRLTPLKREVNTPMQHGREREVLERLIAIYWCFVPCDCGLRIAPMNPLNNSIRPTRSPVTFAPLLASRRDVASSCQIPHPSGDTKTGRRDRKLHPVLKVANTIWTADS